MSPVKCRAFQAGLEKSDGEEAQRERQRELRRETEEGATGQDEKRLETGKGKGTNSPRASIKIPGRRQPDSSPGRPWWDSALRSLR